MIWVSLLKTTGIPSIYTGKPLTPTQFIIHNTSTHPISHKHVAFHSIIHRLENTPLPKENIPEEIDTIKQIAIANRYSTSLINTLIRKKVQKLQTLHFTSLKPFSHIPSSFISTPYFGKISQKIANIIHKNTDLTDTLLTQFIMYTFHYVKIPFLSLTTAEFTCSNVEVAISCMLDRQAEDSE